MLATRYVYYRNSLQRLPPSLAQLTEDVFSGDSLFTCVPKALLKDIFAGKRRPLDIEDESVGDFIARRFNTEFADKFATAMMHGIYAGDAWKLSAEAVLPRFWFVDGEADSLVLEMFKSSTTSAEDAQLLQVLSDLLKLRPATDIEQLWANCGVFTLHGGLEKLTQALETALALTGDVTFKMNTAIEGLELRPEDNKVQVSI